MRLCDAELLDRYYAHVPRRTQVAKARIVSLCIGPFGDRLVHYFQIWISPSITNKSISRQLTTVLTLLDSIVRAKHIVLEMENFWNSLPKIDYTEVKIRRGAVQRRNWAYVLAVSVPHGAAELKRIAL
jgi:hypothetical protein